MKNYQILVIEDNITLGLLLKEFLESKGNNVTIATTGKKGFEFIIKEPPQLILLDYILPDIKGVEFCKKLKEHGYNMPVIIISAIEKEKISTDLKGLNLENIVEVITKPFDFEVFYSTIEPYLADSKINYTGTKTLFEQFEEELNLELGTITAPEIALNFKEEFCEETITKTTVPDYFNEAKEQIIDELSKIFSQIDIIIPKDKKREFIRKISREDIINLGDTLFKVAPLNTTTGLKGDLNYVALAEVMQMLQLQSQTGELEITSRGRSVSIFFRNGLVDLVMAKKLGEEFLLGKFLIITGVLTKEQLEEAFLEIQSDNTKIPIGEKLVKHGFITYEQLTKALMEQSIELIYEVLRWKEGLYTFWKWSSHELARSARLGLPVSTLLLEGFRRVDEWLLIEEELPDINAKLKKTELVNIPERINNLSEQENYILTLINDDGNTIYDVIIKSKYSKFETCKILYRLKLLKFIKVIV